MKPYLWPYPILAIIGVGGWLVFQQNAISRAEENIRILKERQQQMHRMEERSAFFQNRKAKAGQPKEEKLDWKMIAEKYAGKNGSRDITALDKALAELSRDGFLQQADAVESMEMDPNDRSYFLALIADKLAKIDPQLALERFSKQLANENMTLASLLRNIFVKWVVKSPDASIAWLDQQIIAGTFENKSLNGINENLTILENRLLFFLLSNDPARVATRIAAMSEDQRMAVLSSSYSFSRTQENDLPFINLVRSSLTNEEARSAICRYVSGLANGGDYSRVDAVFSSAELTGGEKSVIAHDIMANSLQSEMSEEGLITRLDRVRAWANKYFSEDVDEMTGQALALPFNDSKYADAAVHYQESTGSDAVLVAYLYQSRDPGDGKLIEKVKDPAQRAMLEKRPQYKTK